MGKKEVREGKVPDTLDNSTNSPGRSMDLSMDGSNPPLDPTDMPLMVSMEQPCSPMEHPSSNPAPEQPPPTSVPMGPSPNNGDHSYCAQHHGPPPWFNYQHRLVPSSEVTSTSSTSHLPIPTYYTKTLPIEQ